jgi:hypothetical protein
MFIDSGKILSIFQGLEGSNIPYILLRNINNELPNNFIANKDIDIIIHPDHKKEFYKFAMNNGWKKVNHPWNFGNNFIFLYAMDPFEFYTLGEINIDVCFQLSCRSTNNGEWMPIDMLINSSAWENKKRNTEYGWFELSIEDEIVHLLTRCVFDKKEFSKEYIERIQYLNNKVNSNSLLVRLDLVFFKFTPFLIKLINENKYNEIRKKYLTFIDY